MHHQHVDHYFCIGSSHARAGEPCQDYALSGTLPDGRVYGIVTDGCSVANARTDLGARVLALCMEAELQHTTSLDDCFTPAFVQRIRQRLLAMPLGGTPQDYLASIVTFCADGNAVRLFMAGDGAYALHRLDGSVQVTDVAWPDNAPYYLGYCLQPGVAAQFASPATKVSASVQLTTHSTGAGSSTREIPVQQFLNGWTVDLPLSHISALTICSDGIAQISGLKTLDVATTCLAFKNFEGSFVKRRTLKALAQWEKAGHIPQDDFSIAALIGFTAGPPQGEAARGSDPRIGGAWGPALEQGTP